MQTFHLQIEDLKAQLESCHQQLLDSNKHKQELELQLRIALEREQDIRSGYISPVSQQAALHLVSSAVADGSTVHEVLGSNFHFYCNILCMLS